MNDRPRVTIRDVAADLGLSISTVSRALTGARAVTPEVAQKVRDSAARLGYRPDSIGRSLRTKRTHSLGLVIPDITNPFFPALVQAVEHAARERGLGVLIGDSDNDPTAERDALRTLIDRRVDAILISATDVTASLDALAESALVVPTIQIDRVIDSTIASVGANQSVPIQTIVSRLHATGRHSLAFVGQQTTIATSVEREDAFVELMRAHSSGDPLRVVKEGMSAESGRVAARQLLESWPEIDAIICANDMIAVGVIQELGNQGRHDVVVSGFDDTLLSRAMRFTSVRQPVDTMARIALDAATDPGGLASDLEVELTSEVIFRGPTA